ncbi:hypothetical protein K450DRAFT_280112 [Umbelopsis ramanniana AG]|uniref:Amino acid permease/ SLC12A domain-containing protein n=1 Tax=Umbelopsis ramanniana AG TaxID=1314678 RepID=A0AAD5EA13_UMBRA|nr:uncharacterized protein K450DRAFT_280112 [Umbelopsis ramanniana AG]KAI8580116.1 hypothetical protein K450DRAFT_280112 [Umbelopsis ramanniana AG]
MDLKDTGNSGDLEFGGYSKEQHISTLENVEIFDNQDVVEKDPNSLNAGLQRGLKDRHMSMIAIGGSIGTGLFLSSGATISQAGPGGALVAWSLIGLLVYAVSQAMGEMATAIPVASSWTVFAGRFIDPSIGFAVSWSYWFNIITGLASELIAAANVVAYWNDSIPTWAMSIVFWVVLLLLNMPGIAVYGEIEYWFCLIKVITIIVFIIISICVISGGIGGVVYGVKYFGSDVGGGPFKDGFVGVLNVLINAVFSYGGFQNMTLLAGEAKDPHKTIPKAVNKVWIRILLFYIVSIFCMCCLVSQTDPRLLSPDHSVVESPFTIAFQKTGVSAAASILNAVILTSILSAGNSNMYSGSRILLSLVRSDMGPSFAKKYITLTNRWGVPYVAVFLTSIGSCVCFVTGIVGNGVVLTWLIALSGVTTMIAWASITFGAYRFRRAWSAQGRSQSELLYRAPGYPYMHIASTALNIIMLFIQGWSSFSPFNVSSFFSAYVSVLFFVILFAYHKIANKTKWVKLSEMDLDTDYFHPPPDQDDLDDTERNNVPKWRAWMTKVSGWIM